MFSSVVLLPFPPCWRAQGLRPFSEFALFFCKEVMYVSGRRFEPNEWQRAKMDSMNGEQKKRYLDIIERKS